MIEKAVLASFEASRLVVLTHRCLDDLGRGCGNIEAAVEWLHGQANRIGRPVGVNMKDGDTSQTLFLSPSGWSSERLRGYVATAHVELEDAFGPVSRITAKVGHGQCSH